MYKKGNKIIASVVVFIMMIANISTIGVNIGEVFATDSNLNKQSSKTNHENVEFNSYFVEGENKTYEVTKNIGEENKVIAQITVKNTGYLKSARVDFSDANFKISDQINSEKVLSIKNNILELNQIDNGEDIILEIPLTLEHSDCILVQEFNKINKVTLTGIYVNENGKQYNIKKEINLGLKWTANEEAILEGEISKYVPYDINGQKGLIMQMVVKSTLKNNLLPIKENEIEIIVPEINGIIPTEVSVYSKENLENFGSDNYKYNEEDKKLIINTQNVADENGKVFWNNKLLEEYVITYEYSEEALNSIGEDGVNVSIKMKSNIKTYSYEEKNIQANYENIINLNSQIGDIVDFTILTDTNLSKGYMYANYNSTEKLETVYTKKVISNIVLPELIDSVIIEQEIDEFIIGERTYISDTYYKNLKIDKNSWKQILGEEGYIKIYSEEKLIATIDKNTEAEEQIVVNLNIDKLKIETSKPIAEGELVFEIEKAIKADSSYTKAQVQNFEGIKLQINGSVINSESVIANKVTTTQLDFVEPNTQAELVLSDTNFSTIVKNENIELKAVLKTDSIYNKLYENPTILIDLPSYIENIEVKNVQLLFEDELTIKEANLVQNADGTKQIEIKLKGVQTKYSIGAISEGANIVITADITSNNLTPNTESQIKMTCINNKEQVESTVNINFIAPTGVVTVNKITDFAEGAQLMALTSDEQATIEVTASARKAMAEIQIINNYNNVINEVRILGRTLVQETTNIESGNSLNNTFDAPMLGEINTNGLENVTIYYTENGAATEDLQNSENGWTTEVTDFSKIKTYLIILNDYTMNIGDSIKFNYDVQIPENLNYSEIVNSVYTVYFNNIQEEQILQDKANSRMITLATGIAPTLEVKLNSDSEENSIVREGQYVKFTSTIENTGTVDAENVQLNITAPNGKIYTYLDESGNISFTEDISKIEDLEKQLVAQYSTKHTQYVQDNYTSEYVDSEEIEKTISVGKIEAGKTVEVEYELKISEVEVYRKNLLTNSSNELVEPETTFVNKVRVIADDLQKEVESNEYKLDMQEGYMTIRVSTNRAEEYVLIKGSELTYSVRIQQRYSQSSLKNLVVKVQIPQGLTVKNTELENLVISEYELKYTTSIDEENNVVTFNIEEFPIGSEINCKVLTQVNEGLGNIQSLATVEADGIGTHYSNIAKNKISKLTFEIQQKALQNQYVKEKEQITYTYEIENTSDVYTNSFKFENKIPDGMKFVNAKIIQSDTEQEIIDSSTEDIFTLNLNSFKAGKKITVQVTMEAQLLPSGTTEKEITNYATISGEEFETLNSNSVKTVIEYNKDAHTGPDNDDDGDDDKDGRYIISGVAWNDSDNDGERDSNEELLTGIEVRLLNKNTNEIIKDIDSGSDKVTYTSSTGEYRFTNLEKGEYLVIFLYNSAKYDLTQYKKTNVSDSVNSDVINIDMSIDGKQQKVAISDTIRILDSNVRNIDIGLCESNKSDLKLDKYISTITVTYGNTVKTYEYEDVQLAKVEIPAKELSNATVIVEYKIVVTNEGAIGNYIKKIVDYVPNDMKFNSELNRDWYQSSNGDLYNSSLSNTKLESGETTEVTLTLIRKMTDNNVGIVNNNAELYEVYNEEGIQDIDSTPGNKANGEDDMSAADVVISIKTGDAIIYTAIISAVICIIIGISIYYIRKYVLRRM